MTQLEGRPGFRMEEVTIDATKANIKALTLMLPIAAMVGGPFYAIWHEHLTIEAIRSFIGNNKTWITYGTLIGFLVMIAGIVAHELIHGITWARYSKGGFSTIRFGVFWKELTPYCHCSEPLTVRHYVTGALMPAIILGFIPSLISFFTGNVFVLAFGLFFTVAAAGDFMIINMLRKEKDNDFVQDHPSKIGYYIFRRENPE